MSQKLMRAAHSRHTPGSHPKDCPICNPPVSEKYVQTQLKPTRQPQSKLAQQAEEEVQ